MSRLLWYVFSWRFQEIVDNSAPCWRNREQTETNIGDVRINHLKLKTKKYELHYINDIKNYIYNEII